MARYKLSDNRTVVVPDGDEAAYKIFQEKLKENNLTAELIEEGPGKQEGSSTETETEQTQINETNPSQNNPTENTEFNSEDVSSVSSSEDNSDPNPTTSSQPKTRTKINNSGTDEFINSTPNETLTYENAPEWFNNRAVCLLYTSPSPRD